MGILPNTWGHGTYLQHENKVATENTTYLETNMFKARRDWHPVQREAYQSDQC